MRVGVHTERLNGIRRTVQHRVSQIVFVLVRV